MVKIKGVKKLTFSQPAEQKPANARWKRPGIEKTWKLGRGVIVEHGAPNVVLMDIYGGGMHTIQARHVQIQVRGPRGGLKWEPLVLDDRWREWEWED